MGRRGGGAKHDVAASMLLEGGATGDQVMAFLRSKCTTEAALSCTVSRVRQSVIATLSPPTAQLEEALAPFRSEDGVSGFLQLPSLNEMVRLQAAHRADPRWSDAAEAALASVSLLPPEVDKLRLSARESAGLKRTREVSLLKRQEHVTHVHRAHEWVCYATAMARAATVTMSPAQIALPLLLLCGRRTTELLNGLSTFTPTERATVVRFRGAIKKRGADSEFPIPLLCDSATFLHALGVLRVVQAGEQLPPDECNQRYAWPLKMLLSTVFPALACDVHQLRSVYASLAYHLYSSSMTFNRAAMLFLGHEKIGTSLSYNRVLIHDAGVAGSYGPMPVSSEYVNKVAHV